MSPMLKILKHATVTLNFICLLLEKSQQNINVYINIYGATTQNIANKS